MYCLLMMGLGLMAFAGYTWVPVVLLRRNGQRVTAEVLGPSRETTYELTVRYRPLDEEPLELRVFTARWSHFKPGQPIQIIYNPAKPKAKAILPEENLTAGPMLLSIVGFIVTCLGLSVVWK
jgi:hypothetical protein